MQEKMTNISLKGEDFQTIPVKVVGVKSITDNLLESLSAKQKLVISSRFGISNGDPKTLEAIGKSLNITRERVRQIEADAIKILRKSEKNEELKRLTDTIEEIVAEKGGIVPADTLSVEVFGRYFDEQKFSKNDAQMMEVLFFLANLKKDKGNKEIKDSWSGVDFDKKYFHAIVGLLEKIFDSSKELYSAEEILKKIDHTDAPQTFPQLKPEHTLNFLEVSKKFGKNVFSDWGKAKWPLIRPRGVREKATLVLLKRKKPLHFRDISRLIEELGLSEKKVHPQTVHNELIRDKRFVLVGRGTYALREWGYEEGTVKEIIVSILSSMDGFLSKENLVNSVLKKRKVKKATIAVNLADKNIFEKGKGGYKLKAK
jgi:hypothetical protein